MIDVLRPVEQVSALFAEKASKVPTSEPRVPQCALPLADWRRRVASGIGAAESGRIMRVSYAGAPRTYSVMIFESRGCRSLDNCSGGLRPRLVQITFRPLTHSLRLGRLLCGKASPFRAGIPRPTFSAPFCIADGAEKENLERGFGKAEPFRKAERQSRARHNDSRLVWTAALSERTKCDDRRGVAQLQPGCFTFSHRWDKSILLQLGEFSVGPYLLRLHSCGDATPLYAPAPILKEIAFAVQLL